MAKRLPNRYLLLISAIHLLVRTLPTKLASELMARVLGTSSSRFLKTQNIEINICDIFPDMDNKSVKSLARQMVENFGRHVAEIAHIPAFRDGRQGTSIVVQTPAGTSLEDHGAAIYIGAHVGSWELMPLALNRNKRPLTVIYTKNVTPFIDMRLNRMREGTGARYVEKLTALKPCIRALEQGGSIALLVDQRVDPGIEVDFFGRPTMMTRFPARLATRFNRPIIPFEVVRSSPGHLSVVFQNPIMPDGATGKRAEAELTQRMAEAVEESIKRNADTWFCSKLRWKEADKIKEKKRKSGASLSDSPTQDAFSS